MSYSFQSYCEAHNEARQDIDRRLTKVDWKYLTPAKRRALVKYFIDLAGPFEWGRGQRSVFRL